MYRICSNEEIEVALALSRRGLSDYEVSRRTGIARSSVQRWRTRGTPARTRRPVPPRNWRPADPHAYGYLLGLYLGDGYVWRTGRAFRLQISLDPKYPEIVAECAAVIPRVVPSRVCVNERVLPLGHVIRVEAHSPLWSRVFPQHAPGRKHERKIVLEDWQREITHTDPRPFLRGLIHSDGSRCTNRFKMKLKAGSRAYEYPRYFFTNHSADIRGLFCEHCELLGIRWTQSNWRNISVSHRDSVAVLDSFIGPKR